MINNGLWAGIKMNRAKLERAKKQTGFTLIELLVVVAIIGILAGLAYPNYTDYLVKSRITQATSGLGVKRTQMEQYFQDRHTYKESSPDDLLWPCTTNDSSPYALNKIATTYFEFTCDPTPDERTYTIKATGRGTMAGFVYTVNQLNQKTSDLTASAYSTWGGGTQNCWITGKNGC